MEVVPNSTQEKYSKSEIVVAIVKCVALAITLLGVTFILTVNPQVVCQCPGISPQMTKADIAMYPASKEMDSDETDKVINATKFQDHEETQALTEEILSEQVTPSLTLDDLTLNQSLGLNFND